MPGSVEAGGGIGADAQVERFLGADGVGGQAPTGARVGNSATVPVCYNGKSTVRPHEGEIVNAESIRELMRRQPFEAFEVRMTNGDAHRVRHPELAWLAGSRLMLHYPETDRLVILSLLHVAAIEMLQPAAATK